MKKFITLLIVGLMGMSLAIARENSPWREVQVAELPQNTTIYEGMTRTGNPKYWIKIEGVKISVAPTNAAKFKEGQVRLEVVKWYNDNTKAYKYSTRQVKGTSTKKESKNINLSGVF